MDRCIDQTARRLCCCHLPTYARSAVSRKCCQLAVGRVAWLQSGRRTGAGRVLTCQGLFDSAKNLQSDQVKSEIALERSNLVYQELILLLWQLDLDAALQRALNREDYSLAQAVRARREKVDKALLKLQAAKKERTNAGQEAEVHESDLALQCLRIQGELQAAIEKENYSEASRLRDLLQSTQLRAEAALNKTSQDREQLERRRAFRLGQRVVHKRHGYRGVVCGWDGSCMEQSTWQEEARIAQLSDGDDQPFYHVLVHSDDYVTFREPGVTYVPQELLSAPQEPKTWLSEYGPEAFDHIWLLQLFLGHDERGDLIPNRHLREKYLQPRLNIEPPPGTEGA